MIAQNAVGCLMKVTMTGCGGTPIDMSNAKQRKAMRSAWMNGLLKLECKNAMKMRE